MVGRVAALLSRRVAAHRHRQVARRKDDRSRGAIIESWLKRSFFSPSAADERFAPTVS